VSFFSIPIFLITQLSDIRRVYNSGSAVYYIIGSYNITLLSYHNDRRSHYIYLFTVYLATLSVAQTNCIE
jgi:hypothetical protein